MRQSYSSKKIISFLEKHYNLNITSIRLFESGIENTNYLIKTKENKHVFRTYEELSIPSVEFEVSFINECKKKKLPVQKVSQTIDKKKIIFFNEKPAVLLSYIEGEDFTTIPLTKDLAIEIGTLIAKFHKKTSHYKPKGNPARKHYWDAAQFLVNEERLKFLHTLTIKKRILDNIKEYKLMLPILQECPRGIIHNDFNAENILIKENKISGVIDFGDAIETFLIGDLAIPIAHICFQQEKPLELARVIVAAYNKEIPLTVPEKEVLFLLVKLRFMMGIITANYLKEQLGEQKDLNQLMKWGFESLLRIEEIGKERFDDALGLNKL
jgi:ethanolamine-phosphate phospho-lyase